MTTTFKICRNCGASHGLKKRKCKCGGTYFDNATDEQIAARAVENAKLEKTLNDLSKDFENEI